VIGTLEPRPVDDAAEGKSRASMHAQVAPGIYVTRRSPHDDVLPEEPDRDRPTAGEVGRARNRMLSMRTGSSIIRS